MIAPGTSHDRGLDEASLRDLVRRVARRWRPMSIVAVGCFGLVAFWTFTATPRYQSSALLRIESRSGSGGMLDQLQSLPGAGLAGLGKDDIETEIGVLRSRHLADAAIDSFGLALRVREPADGRPHLRITTVGQLDADGRITLQRNAQGAYQLTVTKWIGGGTPTATSIKPGEPLRLGGVEVTIVGDSSLPARFVFDVLPRFRARERLDKRLEVRHPEGGSRLVTVSFTDEDRRLAAAVVQRLVAQFMRETAESEQHDAAGQLTELRQQADAQRGRVREAEEALRAYQQSAQILAPDEQSNQQVKRIGALNAQVDAISIERRALSQLLELVKPRANGGRDPSAYRQLATFPSLIANRGIQDLLQALITLENKRSELAVRRTDDNDELRQASARIAELERQLQRTSEQYLEGLDQQLGTAVNQIRTIADTMRTLPEQQMQYIRLVRDRTIASETYLLLLKQLKQSEIADAIRLQRIRIVDAPLVPSADDPQFPKPLVQLLLGALLAIAAAGGLGLALELWNDPR
jgi:uncharacterized protein involved in exopolysaccharide biosynthesis